MQAKKSKGDSVNSLILISFPRRHIQPELANS